MGNFRWHDAWAMCEWKETWFRCWANNIGFELKRKCDWMYRLPEAIAGRCALRRVQVVIPGNVVSMHLLNDRRRTKDKYWMGCSKGDSHIVDRTQYGASCDSCYENRCQQNICDKCDSWLANTLAHTHSAANERGNAHILIWRESNKVSK